MKFIGLIAVASSTALGLGGLSMQPANAAPADFYAGKTVSITVSGSAGASLGLYCRLFAAHWGKHIPGTPNVICQFRPGGGGTKGASWVYNKGKKDGTDAAQILSPSVLAPTLRGAKYDASKFIWLGSITPRPAVVTVWHTSPVKTIEEAKKTSIIMGSTGFGSETYLLPMFMNATLGTKFQIIRGYKGGAPINKAMETGEVHGRMNYWTGWTTVKKKWLDEKKIIQLVQYGPRIPALPDTPHLRDLLTSEEHKQMLTFLELSEHLGMGFWVPPGVPKDRVEALRKAFTDTMKDKEFLADAKKKRARVDPISGAEIEALANKAFATPEPVLAKLRGYLKFKKK
ncbi:MAG: tripartite tricarboxylate transporter substrate-binding protein [Alphaproteobacteria bacterium]|nr:tripartite tricarboxylate transporter substrate-binding protein [Alphaproteobacteria bacterium]